MTAASPTSQQENKYSMTDQSMEEARQVRANHHQQEKKHKMAGQHSGKVARKGHAAASSTHTKAFLLRNITSMLLFTLVGFLLLMVSFEKKMHTHKKISKQDLRLQHTLKAIRGGASSHAKREMAKHQKAKVFNWKPLQGECRGIQTDPFPPSFDLKYYQKENGRGKTYQHYIEVGRSEGLNSSKGQRLKEFINTEILQNFTEPERQQDKGLILEIGPFLNPMLVGEGIKYFDILDLAGLEERAKQVGYPEIKKVPIDYVSPSGDLSVISEQGEFSLVVSSNVLLNQLSLVEHLKQVGNLLKDGGYYAMTLSDKRYTFDHYLPETSIAVVLDDYYNKRGGSDGIHRLKAILEHRALTVHNDVPKHWAGDHGPQYPRAVLELLRNGVAEYETSVQEHTYVDVHHYNFTPQGLAFIVDTLHNLGLTELRVHRLYETVKDRFEFGIVLKKCKP